MPERLDVMILFVERVGVCHPQRIIFLGPAMQLLIAVQRLIISKGPKWCHLIMKIVANVPQPNLQYWSKA